MRIRKLSRPIGCGSKTKQERRANTGANCFNIMNERWIAKKGYCWA